jgi:hypothetical protein
MQKHTSGERVERGFYWNVKGWEAQPISTGGGVLKGAPGDTFVKVPLLAVLFLAPLMGAVYAIFLPFIGFAMVAMYLGGMLKRKVTGTPPASEARHMPKKAA